ncbi:Alpha/Beta hydrolase protein [Mycena amicta]|nr:Alpha/Beta hydrolase protein [Mycena amicta]
MDETRFKQTKTQRGFTYSYYFAAPSDGKPTFFFSHGFPTPAYLWRHQVTFLEPLGYGIVAPDLLGYGGTDKPTDPKFYIGSGLAQDVVDILDKEGIQQVIAVSHDWHIFRSSRQSVAMETDTLWTERSFSWISSRYSVALASCRALRNARSSSFNTAPVGFAKGFSTPPVLAYVTHNLGDEAYRHPLRLGDVRHLYTVLQVHSREIPQTAYTLNKPVLFIAFNKDPIGLPMFGLATHAEFVKPETNLTNKAVVGDHWAVLSQADELNQILLEWVEGLQF